MTRALPTAFSMGLPLLLALHLVPTHATAAPPDEDVTEAEAETGSPFDPLSITPEQAHAVLRAHRARERDRLRATALARRERQNATRAANRDGEDPWRLRIAFGALGTPRSADSLGARGSDAYTVAAGPLLRLSVQRWVHRHVRTDLNVGLAWVAGRPEHEGSLGPEGQVGAALMVLSMSKPRVGIGLGAELTLGRDEDGPSNGNHGFLAPRFTLPVELGVQFASERGGLVIRLVPNAVRMPNRVAYGVFFTLGIEFAPG